MPKRCPECGHETLDYDPVNEIYRCLLRECNYKQEENIDLEKIELVQK